MEKKQQSVLELTTSVCNQVVREWLKGDALLQHLLYTKRMRTEEVTFDIGAATREVPVIDSRQTWPYYPAATQTRATCKMTVVSLQNPTKEEVVLLEKSLILLEDTIDRQNRLKRLEKAQGKG